jgi:hypothetical protein
MHCYECLEAGVTRDAVGLCHHCSAALCTEYACVVADPVTAIYPLILTVVLPKPCKVAAVRHLQGGVRAVPV